MLRAPGSTVDRARALRKELSPVELRLWLALQQRPGGLKFRKQHPAGYFVLDFYCAAVKLCVEVDGESHDRGDQPEFDVGRDAWIARHGIETLRVTAKDVFRNLDGVIVHIIETARLRLPLHHSPKRASGPPPRTGEVQEEL